MNPLFRGSTATYQLVDRPSGLRHQPARMDSNHRSVHPSDRTHNHIPIRVASGGVDPPTVANTVCSPKCVQWLLTVNQPLPESSAADFKSARFHELRCCWQSPLNTDREAGLEPARADLARPLERAAYTNFATPCGAPEGSRTLTYDRESSLFPLSYRCHGGPGQVSLNVLARP